MAKHPRIVWTPITGIELRISRHEKPILDGGDEVISITPGQAMIWARELIKYASREIFKDKVDGQ